MLLGFIRGLFFYSLSKNSIYLCILDHSSNQYCKYLVLELPHLSGYRLGPREA